MQGHSLSFGNCEEKSDTYMFTLNSDDRKKFVDPKITVIKLDKISICADSGTNGSAGNGGWGDDEDGN